ncbi:hypothetical protein Q7P37_001901 [Cladosporium fusiforme]
MATNANLDWTQSAPPVGYVPAFPSGTHTTSQSANDADVSSLLRGDAATFASRSQDAPVEEDQDSDGRLDSYTQMDTQSTAKANEHLTSEDPRMGKTIPSTPITAFDQDFWSTPHGQPSNLEGMPGYPRDLVGQLGMNEPVRKSVAKPRPAPSNPRLFRPFVIDETQDVMRAHWRTPPIVGSYVLHSNKRVKYNPIPPKVELVREKLFRLEEPILLKNSQEVADYLPHITNLWRRAVQRVELSGDDGLQVEYWHCRCKKQSPVARKEQPKGLRNREKKTELLFGDQVDCKMRVRVTSLTKHADTLEDHSRWGSCKCIPDWIHFKRACVDPNFTEHTHDQEIIEVYKHSEAISILAKLKTEEGNSAAGVVKWLRRECGDQLKQAHRLDKSAVANAAKHWKAEHKDLVLRDEVPDDSEEMTTMRRCIDAIVEADADPLRAALREVCKDSHEVTKRALAVLEKNKPQKPASGDETAQEPWRLTEGDAAIAEVPLSGGSRLFHDSGIKMGPHHPSLHIPQKSAPCGFPQQAPSPAASQGALPVQQGVGLAPRTDQALTIIQEQPSTLPQPQSMPSARAPGQSQPPAPVAVSRPTEQPYHHVEIRYLQQPPPPPPTCGVAHPIQLSMEVPSCLSPTCRQCKSLGYRGLAGRTFFFQGRFNTESHFVQLQELLRDPKQILDKDYDGILRRGAHMFTPTAERPTRPSGPPPQHSTHVVPTPEPAHTHSIQHQHNSSVPQMQPHSYAPHGQPHSVQNHPATAQLRTQYHALPGHAAPGPHHAAPFAQIQAQSLASASVSERPGVNGNSSRPPNGESNAMQPQDNPSSMSIYDQPLPVPIIGLHEDEEDDNEIDKPPAKRQKREDEEGEQQQEMDMDEAEEGDEQEEGANV